jgi:hypothetical protein
MSRAMALEAAAGIIARSAPNLGALIELLEIANQRRLASALRGYVAARPAEVGGEAKPDIDMWRKERL